MIVDESFGRTGQSYELTRIHHLGERTVRIEVRCDSHAQQSYATAAVLVVLRLMRYVVASLDA